MSAGENVKMVGENALSAKVASACRVYANVLSEWFHIHFLHLG
jgi:hypothetical protein